MRDVFSSCLSTTWLSQILSNSVRGLLISPDPRRDEVPAYSQPLRLGLYDLAPYDLAFAFFLGAAPSPASAAGAAATAGAAASGVVSRARSVMRAALPVRPRR